MSINYVVVSIVALFALAVGYFMGNFFHATPHKKMGEERVHSYLNGQLTNPLLECSEDAEVLSIGDRAKIEEDVTAYAERAVSQGVVSEYAIYFRDLNNGPWFGLNEREVFTPGSLLKLPLAMSYYWAEQRNHNLLDTQIEFVGFPEEMAVESNYGSDAPLQPGVYSVRDLIGYMLKESSNDAAEVLASAAGEEQIQSTYMDLGIEPPAFSADYEIDTKTFGAFFRVLYNASYIGQPSSEELLATLAQTSFKDGIVAGVPEGTKVAHKFGTRVNGEGEGSRQLHDCGIVYAPKSPYILCVMTRGNSSKNLSYFIAGVSTRVYAGVTK